MSQNIESQIEFPLDSKLLSAAVEIAQWLTEVTGFQYSHSGLQPSLTAVTGSSAVLWPPQLLHAGGIKELMEAHIHAFIF